MARVMRRTDDLVVFHGVGFFPCQVEEVLLEVEGTTPHYEIVLDRAGGEDTLEVNVEVSEETPSLDELKTLEALRALEAMHRVLHVALPPLERKN